MPRAIKATAVSSANDHPNRPGGNAAIAEVLAGDQHRQPAQDGQQHHDANEAGRPDISADQNPFVAPRRGCPAAVVPSLHGGTASRLYTSVNWY